MAAMITDAMLNRLRLQISKMFSYAQYKIDDTWYRAELNTADVRTNGAVHVSFYIRRAKGSESPATCFQLCAADGTVLAERSEEIAFAQYMDVILYRFRFGLNVATEDDSK